jgi:thiamine pyrophosphate-dependent acetolactate synthase large subunit-like protein
VHHDPGDILKISGAELLVRSLIANGITHVFNVPGIGIHALVDALKGHRAEIAYFAGPNETSVSVMADGYGRASGRPAFVNVYHASGTALGFLGITTAWADRSPMIFTTTTSSRRLERRDQYASVPRDITDATRQFTKWSWEVPLIERIPEAIARAVAIATTPPMGPVHLAFPMDLYTDSIEEEIARLLPLADPARLRTFPASADPAGLDEAARVLAQAARPLIVSGGPVAQHGAVPELVAIAEWLGAPVLGEPYVAYLGFPNEHDLFVGRFSPASELVQQADVILVAGAEFSETGAKSASPGMPSKLIVLTPDFMDLGKQVWADVGLTGHPKSSLRALGDRLKGQSRGEMDPAWARLTQRVRSEHRFRLEQERQRGWDEAPVHLPRLLHEVRTIFGPDALIMDHSTTGTACLLEMYPFPDPSLYFGISARASAQGWGTPASIGMQIARPERRVVAFLGDGGFMFTSTAIYAAAQWQIPVVFIVLSNGGWHDVAYGARKNRGWTDEELRAFGWVCEPQIDYAGLARSLAVPSRRVTGPDELVAALQEAKAARGPYLLEVDTDQGAVEYYLSFVAR